MKHFEEFGDSFCVLPWVHFATRPHGSTLPCCINSEEIRNDNGAPFYLFESGLDEIWNSAYLREIRRKMSGGERIASCSGCFEFEDAGKISYRQISNWWWSDRFHDDVVKLVEQSRISEFRVHADPQSLDLRLGNSCNSACRSCGPISSSTLQKEWNELRERRPEFEEFWNGKFYEWPGHTEKMDIPPWFESGALLERLKATLPRLKLLYLTGGEPLMVKGNYELLRTCVSEGYAAGLDLMLNTNLTIHSKPFFETFAHFKQVQLFCSIDGFAEANDYLRYPSRWKQIDANLRAVLQIPGEIRTTVNVVAQFHNVLNITDLLRYIERVGTEFPERGLNFDLSVLRDPEWLQLGLLPASVREAAVERLKDFAGDSGLYKTDELVRRGVDGLVALLNAPGTEAPLLREKNNRYTAILDESRSMKLGAHFPELAAMLI